jgi:hypothetical protein
MGPPPMEIGGATVFQYAVLDEQCRPTGNCRHWVGPILIGPANGLAICQDAVTGGYYLFYCDQEWGCIADTWHETQKAAMKQAEFEYQGVSRCLVEMLVDRRSP